MPRIVNPQLTLNHQNDGKIETVVTYDAVFSQFERRLAGLGLEFREQISVIGVDPPGGTLGLNLVSVTRSIFVSDGAGEISKHRQFSTGFLSRNFLDEDPSFLGPDFDQDEIRGRIRILAIGFPAAVTPDTFTDQKLVGGGITNPN